MLREGDLAQALQRFAEHKLLGTEELLGKRITDQGFETERRGLLKPRKSTLSFTTGSEHHVKLERPVLAVLPLNLRRAVTSEDVIVGSTIDSVGFDIGRNLYQVGIQHHGQHFTLESRELSILPPTK